MSKNKIIFSEFKSYKKHLREVFENPYDWWEFKKLNKIKKENIKNFLFKFK